LHKAKNIILKAVKNKISYTKIAALIDETCNYKISPQTYTHLQKVKETAKEVEPAKKVEPEPKIANETWKQIVENAEKATEKAKKRRSLRLK